MDGEDSEVRGESRACQALKCNWTGGEQGHCPPAAESLEGAMLGKQKQKKVSLSVNMLGVYREKS